MSTYLAGYDGSEASATAVAFAADLAGATGASLTVAHVAPAGKSHELLARAPEASHRDGFATREVTASSPARGLHELAEETEASLIAIGQTERGRLTSVPERLMNGAPCPVVVVPASDEEPHPVRVIGVAFDGGGESVTAVHAAERLALACGASLRIIAVDEPVVVGPAVPIAYTMDQSMREWLDTRLRVVLEDLSPDVRASATIEKGEADKAVAEACEGGIDLVVTGSRGFGPVTAVIMGSFSHKLVRNAPCPVLVVPRSGDADEEEGLPGSAAALAGAEDS